MIGAAEMHKVKEHVASTCMTWKALQMYKSVTTAQSHGLFGTVQGLQIGAQHACGQVAAALFDKQKCCCISHYLIVAGCTAKRVAWHPRMSKRENVYLCNIAVLFVVRCHMAELADCRHQVAMRTSWNRWHQIGRLLMTRRSMHSQW